ncbi:decarboxylating 6-phosphogluconate dehydrogenase [soil metagenome]
MKLGVIGLGRMGAAIARRAFNAGYCVLGYDPNIHAQQECAAWGIQIYHDLQELAKEADVIWLMVPAGKIIDDTLQKIVPAIAAGKIIIDGGNSNFNDSVRRAKELAERGVAYLDCGTSGGVHGLKDGFCLMMGGDYAAYEKIKPLLQTIAIKDGLGHFGPAGAGHYVKMIHNGIEYGMLQAYAEGFQLLREGDYQELDLEKVAKVWQHGAVVRSWLLDLTHDVFKQDQHLGSIDGRVQEGGTGAWNLENAKKNHVSAPVLEASLQARKESRETGGNFATKLIQMIRHGFGGHKVEIKRENEL